MGRTTPLRGEIKRVFIPYLVERGFAVDMRYAPQVYTFRRTEPEAVKVCDVQWDKYGRPRFAMNFGKCAGEGVTFAGKVILPGDIFPAHAPAWGRLRQNRLWIGDSWFRQDIPLLRRLASFRKLDSAQAVVSRLIARFPEVEAYWASGLVGPHIRLLSNPSRTPS